MKPSRTFVALFQISCVGKKSRRAVDTVARFVLERSWVTALALSRANRACGHAWKTFFVMTLKRTELENGTVFTIVRIVVG